jgi:hypothetical protein
VLRHVTRKPSRQSSAGSHGARPLVGRSFREPENAQGTRIMNFGSTDGGPSANSRLPVHRAARTDRRRHRSCAPNDRQEQPSQGETRKTVDLDCSSAVQSWRALADVQSARRNHRITAYRLPPPTSATNLHQRLQNSPSYPRLRFERSIKKSSIFLPALSCATIHRGCLPRPAQVSDGSEGFRNLGTTGG